MKLTEDVIALAVIELPENEKVRCQVEGCGRSIYKAVHIVRTSTGLNVIGSRCFAKLYSSESCGKGWLTGSVPRRLTAEERQFLIANTEALIKRLELMFEAESTQSEKIQRSEIAPTETHREKLAEERMVTCYYCKKPMRTVKLRTPALGFKCVTCKENNVPIPLSKKRQRWKW